MNRQTLPLGQIQGVALGWPKMGNVSFDQQKRT